MNIIEKADKYAVGKANETLTQAIAKAYLDGYRDGYNEREAEIPADLRNKKTTYVDLGLPSGTLWSADYEKDDSGLLFLSYERAASSKLPTKEQWNELISHCEWEYNARDDAFYWAKVIGPNGNILQFKRTGKVNADTISDEFQAYFWLEQAEITQAARIYKLSGHAPLRKENAGMFSGYHLPVRLVR